MKRLSNQSGQGVVEMVLLMSVIAGLSLIVSHYLESTKFAQKLIGEPWGKLSAMIECGSWESCKQGHHPASLERVLSYDPNQ